MRWLFALLMLLLVGCNDLSTECENQVVDEGCQSIWNPDQHECIVKCTNDEEFCGDSTRANCHLDKDCMTGGCSGQICQGTTEPSTISTCQFIDCYDSTKYDVACGCVDGKCMWI